MVSMPSRASTSLLPVKAIAAKLGIKESVNALTG